MAVAKTKLLADAFEILHQLDERVLDILRNSENGFFDARVTRFNYSDTASMAEDGLLIGYNANTRLYELSRLGRTVASMV